MAELKFALKETFLFAVGQSVRCNSGKRCAPGASQCANVVPSSFGLDIIFLTQAV